MNTGTIAWFRANKGFGFIHPDDGSDDIYMHAADLVERGQEEGLVEGARVSYLTAGSPKGPKAVKIRFIEAPAGPDPVHEPEQPAPADESWSWQDEIDTVVAKHVQALTDELKQLISGWQ